MSETYADHRIPTGPGGMDPVGDMLSHGTPFSTDTMTFASATLSFPTNGIDAFTQDFFFTESVSTQRPVS